MANVIENRKYCHLYITYKTDCVRLKSKVYIKKYMNKIGSVFQQHDTTFHSSSQPFSSTNIFKFRIKFMILI